MFLKYLKTVSSLQIEQKVLKDITTKKWIWSVTWNWTEKVAATFGNHSFMKRKKWGEEPKDDMIESVEDDP